MSFEPEKIKAEHVRKAIQKIRSENIELRPSTGYDVIVDGQPFPPKEIMRYAHEIMNGEHRWHFSGGEPTNKFLRNMGFEIRSKESINYYVLGSAWDGEDQAERFIKDGLWENGYADKFIDIVNDVKAYDRVAIKSSFASQSDRISYLRVKALGTVIKNFKNGKKFSIKWDPPFEAFDLKNLGTYRKTIQKVLKEHVDLIFAHDFEDLELIREGTKSLMKNIILYGPPGTGKTYHSIDKAVEIAAPLEYKSGDHKANKITFDELRKQKQIEFVTFHQNYSYEDFMIGLRPDIENEHLKFKSHKGIFYEISKRARENYLAFKRKESLPRSFDEVFSELIKPLTEENQEISISMVRGIAYKIIEVSESTIYFKKHGGDSKNTLSIQTLQELVEGTRTKAPSGLKPYYNPLVIKIKEMMRPLQGTKTETEKNFVLVIDEINRANISKVFGELITLLEDDKRLDEENELIITLPNNEDFVVPRNLYIIGTMNTADKSIALIDVALRRRFEFVGHYPIYDGYDSEAAELLRKINTSIFEKKKSADYLIGHAYFMKDDSMEAVLKNKVIPLLMEYFSGKIEVVASIFDNCPWTVKYDSDSYSWNVVKS